MKLNLNTKETNKYLLAFKKIQKAGNILLTTHQNPDGDAIASLGIMVELLELLNKKYVALCAGGMQESLAYLPHTEKIETDEKILKQAKFDLIIALDCGVWKRAGISEIIDLKKNYLIEFDHHPKSENIPSLEIRNPQAVSTTEVLYYFLKTNKIKINKNMANCILTGIIYDTDSFLHPSTSENSILIAAEMLVYGAVMPKITKNRWFNKSLEAMKVWGLALNNLKINKKYNLAFSVLEEKILKDNSNEEDVYNSIANYFTSLHGVKGIIFLREENEGIIKGSLRTTHPKVDISKLARALGGGGHPKASGFIIEGKIIEKGEGYKII